MGDDYAAGRIFLPQLISSAETAKACFDAVRASLPDASGAEKGVIVLATVKGDVHDIGKNIVKTVLENYGYRVVDLGKNVPPEDVAEACAKHGVRLCGLSALMTTTVDNMRVTVERVHARCPGCKVMVGGAVLTADYAAEIARTATAATRRRARAMPRRCSRRTEPSCAPPRPRPVVCAGLPKTQIKVEKRALNRLFRRFSGERFSFAFFMCAPDAYGK